MEPLTTATDSPQPSPQHPRPGATADRPTAPTEADAEADKMPPKGTFARNATTCR